MGRRKRTFTTPGNFLKKQIPIRTYGEWPEKGPGFLEIDLVSHEGGDNSGEYYWTLNCSDINMAWTTSILIKGKGQQDVLDGIKCLALSLPFEIKGIDCDNGSEFINYLLLEYCKDNNIKFTRARPYKKNDNCYVEQKNYSVVRRNVGYLRYNTQEEFEIITQLYSYLDLYNNFFQPSKKLIEKTK